METLSYPTTTSITSTVWSLWRKILFRFSCIYVLLYTTPLQWLSQVPILNYSWKAYSQGEEWLVHWVNADLLHLKPVLVLPNGSGDTSFVYAALCVYTLLAIIGTLIWTVLDKRRNYETGYYCLQVLVRYYVAMFALVYGIIKLFGQQMIFPSLSQLATPLGDLLPMRFSWLFIGYSTQYQFFSGTVETVAGVLLLFRRTSTLGAFVAASVFLNVVMMNLCYDIPVKLFSIHLFGFSVFLLLGDAKRLFDFFVLNRPTQPSSRLVLPKRWMRWTQLGLKIAFITLFGIMPLYGTYSAIENQSAEKQSKRITSGFYTVDQFQSTLPDSLRWADVVFEEGLMGSVRTADTLFRQRYRRGYFAYALDSTKRTIAFKKFPDDSTFIFTLAYTQPDTNHLLLRGKLRNDTVAIALSRQKRQFQLAERQFHWLSEANR